MAQQMADMIAELAWGRKIFNFFFTVDFMRPLKAAVQEAQTSGQNSPNLCGGGCGEVGQTTLTESASFFIYSLLLI